MTLEIDYNQTNLIINSSYLPDCNLCRLKILATDGINTNSSISESFSIDIDPNITSVMDINITGTSDGEIIMGDDVIFNVTVEDNSDSDSINVWLKIWQGIIGASSVIWEGFLSFVEDNLWTATVETNESFPLGNVNYTVYANDSLGNEVNESGIFEIKSLTSSINLDIIHPTTDINVTQNEFFNVTTQVCCYEDDCGEINVSLDPDKDKYTPLTETHCKNGLCTQTIYSGIRFVYEDDNWKKIEEARSLKGVWNVDIDEDPDFPVEIVDFNYTSIILDLSVSDKNKNKDIDLKVYNKENKTQKPKDKRGNIKDKDKKIKLSDSNEKHRVMIDLADTKESLLGQEIKWGDNSTIIQLIEPNSENLEDSFFSEDDTIDGSESYLLADVVDGNGEITFIKFNISSIPSDSLIENATLALYVYAAPGASDEDLDVWYVDNQTWVEETIDSLCSDGAAFSDVWDMFTTKIRTYNGQDGVAHWDFISDLHSAVQTEIDNENSNLSFALNNTGNSSDYYYWSSKETATASQRPYLNITYSEPTKGLVNTTEGATPFYTNISNPFNISLNQNECQNITWWVNATGDADTYSFFVYANKTSNMSISNISDKWDVTINSTVLPNDTYKFFIKNNSGDPVAWLGNEGNIVLGGVCSNQTTCIAPSNSFIIANSSDNTTAYINNTGDLCIEKGDCTDQSATCNPSRDAFIIQNSSSTNMSYIDFDGDLCLTGGLYENTDL